MAKVYTDLNEVEALIKNQGSKFLRLSDSEGSVIVPFNPVGKKWEERFSQAKKKLKALPDGLYTFLVKDNFGPNFYGTKIHYQKGSGPIEISEPMNDKKNGTEALLSVEQAVKNVKESAEATAENAFLKKENEDLRKKLSEMESRMKALELSSEEDEDGLDDDQPDSGPLSWLKETVPAVLPALDRYFDLEEKKLNLQQAKFMHENGYELPGMKRASVPQKKKAKQLPEIEGEGWEDFVNYFISLPDEEYHSRMQWLRQNAPDHYEALLPLVEEETTTEEETTEENGPDPDEQ